MFERTREISASGDGPRVCGAVFGESLDALAESAYVAAGTQLDVYNGRFHQIH